MQPFVLVVDDDADMALCIADALREGGCRCEVVESGAAALEARRRSSFDVVLSDIRMEGMDGVELMTRLHRDEPTLPVVLMTVEGSVSAAVAAVKHGAFDYITKPCDDVELRHVIDLAIATRTQTEPPPRSREGMPSGTEELIGKSPSMVDLRARIDFVGAASSPVLVIGETGTGKELVARAIHACSARRAQPFVTVNTAAIPEALLESVLFGHAKGAFTGATQAHRGLFVEADRGTLLLDEIGDMPLGLQAKLLRVLQAGEIRPVGATQPQRVDVRVIAATHQRLPALVRAGHFREDLFYRLDVITLEVPPLRSRPGDIALLANDFLRRAREHAPRSPVTSISPELIAVLEKGAWPGNVRELESAIERLVVFGQSDRLEPTHFDRMPADIQASVSPGLDSLIRAHVDAVLAQTAGSKPEAAKLLGVDLSTLYRWQRKWRDEKPAFGDGSDPR